MANTKRKSNPGLITIMYHVFIGSVLKILWQVSKYLTAVFGKCCGSVLVGSVHTCKWLGIFFVKLIKFLALLPVRAGKAMAIVAWTKTKSLLSTLRLLVPSYQKILSYICKQVRNFGQFIWQKICGMLWWIKHQLALTSLKDIQSHTEKPMISIGWELYNEFHPRHKLDYWMGDSHITVEIRSYTYNIKYNRLRYVESGSKRHNHVHSPHGIPHMVTKLHWYEPPVSPTVKPYTPLHTLVKADD